MQMAEQNWAGQRLAEKCVLKGRMPSTCDLPRSRRRSEHLRSSAQHSLLYYKDSKSRLAQLVERVTSM